ncbi:MAG: glycosyltransferase family 2 protein [Armatimonadetes bacterium]|nr:glycosyltransferase family 2 protein [Armatimonadota bacterium]
MALELSLVIITCNEAHNLPRCLASVAGLPDEVVVVDSGSTDGTVELAREAGCKVIHHDWPGYGPQVTYAMEQASCPWLLRLDADEALSPALRASLERWKASDSSPFRAYRMLRRDWFYHRFLRATRDWFVRLGHRDAVKINRSLVHETWQTTEPIGRLDGYLDHYSVYLYAERMARLAKYSQLNGLENHQRGKRFRWHQPFVNPVSIFLRTYLLEAGFLDGWPGFLYSASFAHYIFAKYVTLWEYQAGHQGQAAPVTEAH